MFLGMLGEQTQQIEQGHIASPQVGSSAGKGFGGQILQQLVIFGTQLPHGVERLRRLPLVIVRPLGPSFLIKRIERWVVF
jgi:hypothetical protein